MLGSPLTAVLTKAPFNGTQCLDLQSLQSPIIGHRKRESAAAQVRCEELQEQLKAEE